MKILNWVHAYTSDAHRQGAGDQELFSHALGNTRKVVSTIMDEYMGRCGKSVWSEKSVHTIDEIDLVSQVFPNARYICLHRSCSDAVASGIETLAMDPTGQDYGFTPYLAIHPGNRTHGMVEYWLDKANRILQFEQGHAGTCYRVRYEDIAQQPTETITGMFDFLELEWDQALTDSVFTQHHPVGPGDHKIVSASSISTDSIGKGVNLARTPLPTDLAARLKPVLSSLGYPAWG